MFSCEWVFISTYVISTCYRVRRGGGVVVKKGSVNQARIQEFLLGGRPVLARGLGTGGGGGGKLLEIRNLGGL